MDEILRVVRALQVADENKVSTPANWPNNMLIGDDVIIPPPADEKDRQGKGNGWRYRLLRLVVLP